MKFLTFHVTQVTEWDFMDNFTFPFGIRSTAAQIVVCRDYNNSSSLETFENFHLGFLRFIIYIALQKEETIFINYWDKQLKAHLKGNVLFQRII